MQHVVYRHRPAVDRSVFGLVAGLAFVAATTAALYAGAHWTTAATAVAEPTFVLAAQGPNDQDALGQLARPEFLTDQDALDADASPAQP